jgi:hypothetical protein
VAGGQLGSSIGAMTARQVGPPSPPANRGRLQAVAPIVLFDVAGPLVVYYSLRSGGLATVPALVLSGVLPAFGVALSVVRHRRLDAVGALVLAGIVVGTVLGIVSGSAHLVLLEGTVGTAAFGAACLGSLWAKRPLMFRFALEFVGADTPKGRDFADHWRYDGFRHAFRVTTVVWGLAYLAEAAAQAAIVESASAGTAKATSTVMPLVVAAAVATWNVSYAKRGQRKGELAAEAARARGDMPPTMPV